MGTLEAALSAQQRLNGLLAETVEEEASRVLETEGGKEKHDEILRCAASLDVMGEASLASDVRANMRQLRKRVGHW